jgi:hypothetical protein
LIDDSASARVRAFCPLFSRLQGLAPELVGAADPIEDRLGEAFLAGL